MELTIKLSEQEANLILAGLAELPAKHSIDLILKFKQLCIEQIQSSQVEEV